MALRLSSRGLNQGGAVAVVLPRDLFGRGLDLFRQGFGP